jgi:hypothetical protein
MIGRHISALALLLSCASAPLHANTVAGSNGDCWRPTEVEALKVQRFKTMLLVAMLNCRDQEPGIGADYNRFVRANRDLIASRQAAVREHFIRARGLSAGLIAYSAYETALGNQFSDADFTPDRCASAAADARLAGYVSERGLLDMIQSVPDEDLAICDAQPRFAARQAEWATPPAPLYAPRVAEAAPVPVDQPAAVETAQNEWPDLAPIEPEGPARAVDPNEVQMAEAAPPPPAAMPERLAEPVQVAAVEMPKPAPVVDRAKAVRDAARALREALAALEAEEGEAVK